MTVPLTDILKWVGILTLLAAATTAVDATPIGGGGWNAGRLLTAGIGGVLALLLFALREFLVGANALRQEAATLRRMREQLDFLCHRIEAVRLGQAVYVGDHTALTLLEPAHPLYVDTRCRHVAPHLITTGLWEPQYLNVFRRQIRPGQTVLDIGANHGAYAIQAAAATGAAGHVHAFEPNPRLADLIRRSAEANGYTDRLSIHVCAVGAEPGQVELVFSDEASGGGSTRGLPDPLPPGYRRLHVPVVALDEMFPPPAPVHVIKMDIEGYEGLALRGMRGLLTRSADLRMLMEYGPALLRQAGTAPEEVIGGLATLGFRFWTIHTDGATEAVTAESLIATAVPLQNVLVARQDPL